MIVGNSHSRRITLVRRVVASALVASWVLSCQTYRPVPTATINRGSPREYARLRILIRGGYVTELAHAFIRPDSVVGFTMGKEPGRRIAVARDQIVRVESYERDVAATLRRATVPPPDAGDGEIAGSNMCPMAVNSVCVSRPDPPPTPAPTPSPTP
jgi:hypothetical protein